MEFCKYKFALFNLLFHVAMTKGLRTEGWAYKDLRNKRNFAPLGVRIILFCSGVGIVRSWEE